MEVDVGFFCFLDCGLCRSFSLLPGVTQKSQVCVSLLMEKL